MSRGGQAAGKDSDAVTSEPSAVRQDPHWPAFLQSLKERGFFRGEIDGSQLHRRLMSDAEAFFADGIRKRKEEEGVGGSSPAPAAEIMRILSSAPCEANEYRDTEDTLEPPDGQCLLVFECCLSPITWQCLIVSLVTSSAPRSAAIGPSFPPLLLYSL